tara:strand:- start:271 stop:435 length:165 start_codon:yes stop_codon:yes gene_type:complete
MDNIIKIPPENGGSNLFSINLLWSEVSFLSLIRLNLLNKKLKIKIIKKIVKKLT